MARTYKNLWKTKSRQATTRVIKSQQREKSITFMKVLWRPTACFGFPQQARVLDLHNVCVLAKPIQFLFIGSATRPCALVVAKLQYLARRKKPINLTSLDRFRPISAQYRFCSHRFFDRKRSLDQRLSNKRSEAA